MSVITVLPPTDPFFKGRPFDWEGVLYTTVAEFAAYANSDAVRARLDQWANGVTVHHTWRPTVAQWSANTPKNNLKGLITTWRDKNGWKTGPNMIIAPEGIYLASGIDGPGIHATVCNGQYVGIEVVGDYDYSYWREPIRGFVFGAFVALSKALRNGPKQIVIDKRVNGHRECASSKTCPGKAIDLDKFRKDVALLMNVTSTHDETVIGVPPSVTSAQFKSYLQKYHAPVPPAELERVYIMAEWLEIDPAFVAALWKQEAFVDDPSDGLPGVAIIGGSELQRQTHCPLNIRESEDSNHNKVFYKNGWWRAWSTWQLGLMDSLTYLKDEYGAVGLLTVRQIIPIFSPASDGNDVEQICTNIFTRMAEMRGL